jgi:hypothetical protein
LIKKLQEVYSEKINYIIMTVDGYFPRNKNSHQLLYSLKLDKGERDEFNAHSYLIKHRHQLLSFRFVSPYISDLFPLMYSWFSDCLLADGWKHTEAAGYCDAT